MRLDIIAHNLHNRISSRFCTLLLGSTVVVVIFFLLWQATELQYGLTMLSLPASLGGSRDQVEASTSSQNEAEEEEQQEGDDEDHRPSDLMEEIWDVSQIDEFGDNTRPTENVKTSKGRFSWTLPALNQIPRKIWQINGLKLKEDGSIKTMIEEDDIPYTDGWLAMNLDYEYNLVGPRRADAFVNKTFAHRPDLVSTYHSLRNTGMKSDWLRYMILWHEGGVYSDSDTVALRPIDTWVPESLRDRVRLVVGFEWDRRGGGWRGYRYEVQFAQWTFASAPGHPVFERLLNASLGKLEDLRAMHGMAELPQIKPENKQVLNTTGPWIWTETVFGLMQEQDPSLKSLKELSGMERPRLYGDILLLPIDAFALGRPHSGSTNDGSIPKNALAKHLMDNSWKKGKGQRSGH